MIETVIKDFLDGHLSVPSFLEHQENMPKRYVFFEKLGSSKSNHITSATFAFQSYAESMYETAKLNEELKRVVEDLITLDDIGGISLNSDYNYTDTETKKYRYQAVFDIKYF
ncbi:MULTISPECIES: hypothetical protein [unclassified Lactococcus]|uniref:hypothetical protein n=1 Tax=unclassified Lactococcus TaxID=2643510 RepID=UPI0011C705B2|nr:MULTISPECIES: hypothetical protein [unclassified Lactococcus]MQW23888.1 hypothetical protein [Lactococcus sp. dk101]TXK37118.1 hypothetical protein FVP42_09710 [Lactococcus sp. dk310]TXK47973.1 hypothetical protein FVP43_09435 [Lactococcus sp. dk322]